MPDKKSAGTTVMYPIIGSSISQNNAIIKKAKTWRMLTETPATNFDINKKDIFIDFGCGKGRVLLIASKYKFKKIFNKNHYSLDLIYYFFDPCSRHNHQHIVQ